METSSPTNTPISFVWWGDFLLEEGQAGCWRIGPTTLWIYRASHEWRLLHRQESDPHTSAVEVTLPLPEDAVAALLEFATQDLEIKRYSSPQTEASLRITPALADRTVIVRPDTPFYVLPGEAVTLYVSSPLWAGIRVGPAYNLLCEIPTHRQSDTWFGPSTQDGELCYASLTTGRLNLDRLPFRPHRATTPIEIQNRASDTLLLERVRLPAQHLSLYQSASGYWWTETVVLERESDGELAALSIEKAPPREAGPTSRISPPRISSKGNLIVHAFSSLFHR